MLEQLKYVNHLNEVFEFGKNGIFVDVNELHDFEWNVTKKNNRITLLDKVVTKKKLPVKIICETDEQGIAARNKLYEVTDKDVLAMKHGKIYIGDYYLRCYITKSQKKDYLNTDRYIRMTLTLSTDFPMWIRETTNVFRKLGAAGSTSAGEIVHFDYPIDYPFDYMGEVANGNLINTSLIESNFRMIIYGECENPAIYLAGHCYQINCAVKAGEYLTIDSVTKKITLTATDGTTTNMFNARNREFYIFKKIPVGSAEITWNGDFGVDIILFDERSEPKWI